MAGAWGMMKFLLAVISINFLFFLDLSCLGSLVSNFIFLMGFFFLFSWHGAGGIQSSYTMLSESYFGMDTYSFFMILLSFWVVGLVVMVLENKDVMKMLMIIFLLVIFIGVFSSLGLLGMYFYFELSLFPTFLLVVFWGGNFERVESGMYMLMYTLFISMPFLVYIFKYYCLVGSFSLQLMSVRLLMVNISWFDYLIMFSPFFIKLPIYLFHIWLPKAHVEAPVYGSMILASILLKLGGYGLMRMLGVFLLSGLKYNCYVFGVSFIGALVVSLVSLVQVDLKELVAYSSVVHMNFLLCSLLTLTSLGFLGGLILMVGHGLCSSGLFYMVNIYYIKSGSRVIFLNKGMMGLVPEYTVWWFLLCVSNFSFPFSLSFFGELLMIGSVIMWEMETIFGVGLICFMSGAYSLYLFSYIQHGGIYVESHISEEGLKGFVILFMHIYPLIFMIFSMLIFSS